jgi:hypothetical protein
MNWANWGKSPSQGQSTRCLSALSHSFRVAHDPTAANFGPWVMHFLRFVYFVCRFGGHTAFRWSPRERRTAESAGAVRRGFRAEFGQAALIGSQYATHLEKEYHNEFSVEDPASQRSWDDAHNRSGRIVRICAASCSPRFTRANNHLRICRLPPNLLRHRHEVGRELDPPTGQR